MITKLEMAGGVAGALAAVAASTTLPPGNAGTRAGKPGSVYTIELNNPDTVFFNLLGIDRIELVPLPAASIGCFHAARIFVSGVVDTALDDASKNNLWYSNFAGTKYGFQYDPLNFVVTGRDGQQMMKLISFEKDLIGIKEAKTGRLPGGNVDLEFEVLDHGIGVSSKNLASFVPALGIMAITNDFGDFRVFGYDLRWSKVLGEIDISTPIRLETAAMTAANVSFFYVNGKAFVSDGTGILYALHQKEGRGWTRYSFPMNSIAQRFFTFANGSRAACVSKSTHLVEIEKDVDFDVSTVTDSEAVLITLSETTARFQSNSGKDILECDYLDVTASITGQLTAIPYANGLPWPSGSTPVTTPFVPDPDIHENYPLLSDREYRLYLEPSTVGAISWARFLGNFQHFTLTTTAPSIMRAKNLHAVVDEDGMAGGNFDPFQSFGFKPVLPDWGTGLLLDLDFDIDSTTANDFSGHNRNHTYAAGSGGTRTYDATLLPGGGMSLVGGSASGFVNTSWTGLDIIGDEAGLNSAGFICRYELRFPSLASRVIIHQAGDGTHYWRLYVATDGTIKFDLKTSALSYIFATAAGVVTAGATPYTVEFWLYDGGLTGLFYFAALGAPLASLTTTRSAL